MRVLKPICTGCNKHPEELPCYTLLLSPDENPDEYVQMEEGTYNPENGHFLCDECYIKAGMPTAPNGWRAP